MEVVRLSPNAAEPYHTIGTIHEAKGDPRKALDFYMIAAHLPPKVLRTPTFQAPAWGDSRPMTTCFRCPKHPREPALDCDNLQRHWYR